MNKGFNLMIIFTCVLIIHTLNNYLFKFIIIEWVSMIALIILVMIFGKLVIEDISGGNKKNG